MLACINIIKIRLQESVESSTGDKTYESQAGPGGDFKENLLDYEAEKDTTLTCVSRNRALIHVGYTINDILLHDNDIFRGTDVKCWLTERFYSPKYVLDRIKTFRIGDYFFFHVLNGV